MLQEQVYTVYGELLRGGTDHRHGLYRAHRHRLCGRFGPPDPGPGAGYPAAGLQRQYRQERQGRHGPNSGGRRGIEIAALLGVCGGDATRRLAVLESVTDATRARAVELLEAGICTTSLIEGTDNLVVQVTARAGADEAFVEIRTTHTNVTRMEHNGENLMEGECARQVCAPAPDKSLLNVRDILTYGETAPGHHPGCVGKPDHL